MDQHRIETALATAKRLRRYDSPNVICLDARRFERQVAELRGTLTAEQFGSFMLRLRLQVADRLRGAQ